MEFAARLPDLLRPDAFPHPAQHIRLIETHISWVILAGEYAYKLRKPVNFGFLDFSTVQQRRADCEAEVNLNRRLCSDLYLGVVDVVDRDDGHLYMGGPGTLVEPAVRMRRLPENAMLPNVLERGDADERLMQRLARMLADFHARASTGRGVDDYGSIATLRANWEENFAQTPLSVLGIHKREAIQAYVEQFLDDNAALLLRRIAEGRIRDGHGDLHAASICSTRRHLYLFDCIEFNARFRCADVAAEVAFLAMDLEHLGRADLASAFVDAYVRSSGDTDLPQLLEFYKCYRAFVRAKVLAFRLAEPLDTATSAQISSDVHAYFDLAYSYTNRSPRPLLVVVMGLPASGKTTLARALASRLAMVHVSSDVMRKQLAGLRPTVHRADPFDTGLYTHSMSRRTYAVMRRKAVRWLRRGHSVILDATYGQPAERAAVRRLARHSGARLHVILCQTEETVLEARLAARASEPGSASDARLTIWPALKAAFVPPSEFEVTRPLDTTQPVGELVESVVSEITSTNPDSQTRRAA